MGLLSFQVSYPPFFKFKSVIMYLLKTKQITLLILLLKCGIRVMHLCSFILALFVCKSDMDE